MKIKIGLLLSCMVVMITCGWYRTFVGDAKEMSLVEDSIKEGNEYLEKEYYYEAAESYKKAEAKQESGELEEIISYCYYMLGDEEDSYIWADKAYDNGYKTEFIYQLRVARCINANEKSKACEIISEAKSEDIESDALDEIYNTLKSEYVDMYFSYKDVSEFLGDNAIVWEEDYCYIVNSKGDKKVSEYGMEIYDISTDKCLKERWSDTNKLYVGYSLGEWKYYDENGYVRVSPDEDYDYIGAPKDGMILVKKGDLWGYIDTDFNEVDISYEAATGFSNDRAAVMKNGVWTIVDSSLKPLLEKTVMLPLR